MAVVSIYRGLLTCEWGQSCSRRGTTERTRPQPMSAHGLCLRTAPVCAPSNWMCFNHFAVSFCSPFCLILLLEPFKHKSVFCTCRIWHGSFLFTETTKCSTISPRGCCSFIKCKCMRYWAHFGLFQNASPLCVFFCPIIHAVGLLCRGLSRFTLFAGCNAMPPVGSCRCWRPLGPNWISRGN